MNKYKLHHAKIIGHTLDVASHSLLEVEADDISDEYHSMHELYQHRMALTIALFRQLRNWHKCLDNVELVYRSKLHHDETMFEGYFIVGALLNSGQISYHYKLEHWDKFDFLPELPKSLEYDGHTSKDVIERLMKL